MAQPLRILAEGRANLEPRYVEGAVVGFRDRSVEYVVITADGLIQCRSIKRRPETERWNAQLIMNLEVMACDFLVNGKGGAQTQQDSVIPLGTGAPAADVAIKEPKLAIPRAMMFHRADFETHGYTKYCHGCIAVQSGRKPPAHIKACRERMTDFTKQTAEGWRSLYTGPLPVEPRHPSTVAGRFLCHALVGRCSQDRPRFQLGK